MCEETYKNKMKDLDKTVGKSLVGFYEQYLINKYGKDEKIKKYIEILHLSHSLLSINKLTLYLLNNFSWFLGDIIPNIAIGFCLFSSSLSLNSLKTGTISIESINKQYGYLVTSTIKPEPIAFSKMFQVFFFTLISY